jgi:hypothetical protein
MFAVILQKSEKERIKQVIMYLAKHAVAISSSLDYEVSTKFGREFMRRQVSIILLLLEGYHKRNY